MLVCQAWFTKLSINAISWNNFLISDENIDSEEKQKRTKKDKLKSLKFPCEYCGYMATQAGNLKRHVESKHEGVRYPCMKCDYVTTRKNYLEAHIESIHEGVSYSCEAVYL